MVGEGDDDAVVRGGHKSSWKMAFVVDGSRCIKAPSPWIKTQAGPTANRSSRHKVMDDGKLTNDSAMP